MSTSTLAALRFCLSRNRLLTLPGGEILYFPAGNWFNGRKTSRVWQFVLIDNLRIIAWQIVLVPWFVAHLLESHLFWRAVALLLLLPLIEIVAALARTLWLKSVPVNYTYTGAIQTLYDRFPAIYKTGGFMWAPVGRRMPLVLVIFFMVILTLGGGLMAGFELADLYCRMSGECRVKQAQLDYDKLLLAGTLLLIGILIAFNFRNEAVSLPVEP
ncbi:MAG: hypothetical protein KG075_14485 [Alphaproteobacteria bacterium]|nr:hypothetical protein [Alphaproteobacteria bacterium]